MTVKEATARIKLNKLLEVAGWRFFADGKSPGTFKQTTELFHRISLKTTDGVALGYFMASQF